MQSIRTVYNPDYPSPHSSDTSLTNFSYPSPSTQANSNQNLGDQESELYNSWLSPPKPTPMSKKSKRITKAENAKKRAAVKREVAERMKTAPKKYAPPELEDPNLNEKARKKLNQAFKNRVSAQNSRDTKKKYLSELEEIKLRLTEANKQLEDRNKMLEERVRALEENEAKNRFLEERVRMLEGNEMKNRFLEQNIRILKENEDKLLEENEELRQRPLLMTTSQEDIDLCQFPKSPIPVRHSPQRSQFFSYFFAVVAVLAVYSGLHIKYSEPSTAEEGKTPKEEDIDHYTTILGGGSMGEPSLVNSDHTISVLVQHGDNETDYLTTVKQLPWSMIGISLVCLLMGFFTLKKLFRKK